MGLVGVSTKFEKLIVEINFSENKIKFWDKNIFVSPTCTKNIDAFEINKPSKGFETKASFFVDEARSITGDIIISDTTTVSTQFLIDTG